MFGMELDRRSVVVGVALASSMAFAARSVAAEGQVIVIAELVAKPDQVEALRKLLVPFAAQSRKEPGCLRYELLEVGNEPGRFLTVETWESKAAIDAHMSTPAIKAAVPMLGPILAKPFTQTFLTSVSS
jgi:quinol monooxygenase YgiN